MEWYKTLDIDRRIALKVSCKMICGISFIDLGRLFTFSQRMDMMYNKLKLEGFDI